MPKEIVILGGSYAGLSTAHYLLKHILPSLPTPDYQVVLVSSSGEVFCRPACPRALVSDDMFPQDKLFVSIPASFSQYPEDRFRFVHGTAVSLDHVSRTIHVSLHSPGPSEENALVVTYAALVIATGASTPSPLLGFTPSDTNSHTDPATALRQHWSSFRTQLRTHTARSIIIAGGGPAGVEVAGELGEHLNGAPPCQWVGWFRPAQRSPKVPITLLTAGDRILPALRPTIASTAEGYLARVGVSVVKNARVVSATQVRGGAADKGATAEGGQDVTVVLEDGRTLSGDIYIPCTGTLPNTAFVRDGLLTGDGRVDTNPQTLRVEKGGLRVYAIGDASNYARPAVHNILSAVPVLCANLKLDLLKVSGGAGQEADGRVFKEDTSETQLVPIGRGKGVGAAMGYKLPSWLVWAIKGRDYWLWTTGGLWSGKKWDKP